MTWLLTLLLELKTGYLTFLLIVLGFRYYGTFASAMITDEVIRNKHGKYSGLSSNTNWSLVAFKICWQAQHLISHYLGLRHLFCDEEVRLVYISYILPLLYYAAITLLIMLITCIRHIEDYTHRPRKIYFLEVVLNVLSFSDEHGFCTKRNKDLKKGPNRRRVMW